MSTIRAKQVIDFDTEVSNNSDVTANTAKVTNATHTGEVTGSGVLTVDKTAITGKGAGTVATGDLILMSDIDDSNNLKKVTAQSIADLGGGGGTVASVAEINTGTDNAKFASALALEGSKYLTQSSVKISATAAGTDTYTATIAPAITAYAATHRFYITFTNANTGASTIDLNGIGASALQKYNGAALTAGDILAGQTHLILRSGTAFRILTSNSGSISSSLILNGIVTPAAALSGTENNYTTTDIATSNVVRVVTDGADVLLTGISSTGIANGQILMLVNIDTLKKITLKNNDAGSSASNRFLIDADIAILTEKSAVLWYDGTTARWRKFNT